jgi:hypothetical protein
MLRRLKRHSVLIEAILLGLQPHPLLSKIGGQYLGHVTIPPAHALRHPSGPKATDRVVLFWDVPGTIEKKMA